MDEPDYSAQVFRELMTACPSLKTWNRFILPLMKIETKELRNAARDEAKRRVYRANKTTGQYE